MLYTVLQLTDTHLFACSKSKMFGVSTNEKFTQTIEFIKNKSFEFDCIFLTGDISQDETNESYKIIAETLSNFKKDVYWIPGNHDNFTIMQDVFSKYDLLKHRNTFSTPTKNWNFIFTDTTINGKNSGYLTDANLKLLLKNLDSSDKDIFNVLVMHHHPIEVGTPLIDHFILENNEEFWKTLGEATQKVQAIICGHVHGDYDIIKNGVRVVSSPGTCLQWKKGTKKLSVEEASGFTIWEFYSTGSYKYETFFVPMV